MKNYFLIGVGLLLVTLTHAQNWQWIQTAGSNTHNNRGNAVCTDQAGNLIITGHHRPALHLLKDLRNSAFIELTNYSQRDNRMFVAKYAPDGTLLWANDAKGFFADGQDVTTDPAGNIYLTGNFAEMTTFSSQGGKPLSLNGHFPGMMYLAKYSPGGKLLWVLKGGSEHGESKSQALAFHKGRLYIAGFSDLVPGEALLFEQLHSKPERFSPATPLPFAEAKIGHLAVYNTQGHLEDVLFMGNNQSEVLLSDVVIGEAGQIFLSALFTGDFIHQGKSIISRPFQTDGLVLAYTREGKLKWKKHLEGKLNADNGPTLAISGNRLMVGVARRGGTDQIVHSISLTSSDSLKMPNLPHLGLYMFDLNGEMAWASYATMPRGEVELWGMEMDQKGQTYLCGNFTGDLMTGHDTLSSTGFHSKKIGKKGVYSWWDRNAFQLKYNAEGQNLWASCTQGIGKEEAHGIAVNERGEIFTTGYYQSTQSTTFGWIEPRSMGEESVYLAKMTSDPPIALGSPMDSLFIPQAERKITKQASLSLSSRSVDILLWDNNQIDGDVVSIFVNDSCILKAYRLNANKRKISIELPAGEDHQLLLHAENTGAIYPNTAAISIIDDRVKQTVLLAADLRRSQSIQLEVKENAAEPPLGSLRP